MMISNLQGSLSHDDWQTTLSDDGMTVEILPAYGIVHHAQDAAVAGLPLSACPFPQGSKQARYWCHAYHGKARELLEALD